MQLGNSLQAPRTIRLREPSGSESHQALRIIRSEDKNQKREVRTALPFSPRISVLKMPVVSILKYDVRKEVVEKWLQDEFGNAEGGTVWHVEVRTTHSPLFSVPVMAAATDVPGISGGSRWTQYELEGHSAATDHTRKVFCSGKALGG